MTLFNAAQRQRAAWAYFAGICLFAVCLRIPIAPMPLDRDEGAYAYVAQRWAHGDIPYRDSFDTQPPGVFAIYALIERGIGTGPAAIHWGMQLYTLATLALIFVLGRRLSNAAGGLAAAAFAAFMTTDPSVFGNAATPEVFMILPLTAAMLAACYAVERQSLAWAFVTGVCAGSGIDFQAGGVEQRGVLRRLGDLAVTAPAAGRPGAAARHPGDAGAGDRRHRAARRLGRIRRHRPRPRLRRAQMGLARSTELAWSTLPGLLFSFWPLLLLAAVQAVRGGFGMALSPDSAPAHIRRNTLWVLLWLGASLAGTLSGGYFRPPDYIQLIPPIAVLAGMAVGLLAPQLAQGSGRRAVASASWPSPLSSGSCPTSGTIGRAIRRRSPCDYTAALYTRHRRTSAHSSPRMPLAPNRYSCWAPNRRSCTTPGGRARRAISSLIP